MELLLNLCWLMLALPAYWLWQHGRQSREISGRSGSGRCILVLGCMLVLLFPVVSATDDLHVMRPEMEETGLSKRTIKNASHGRAVGPHVVTVAAAADNSAWSLPVLRLNGLILPPPLRKVSLASLTSQADRAPPAYLRD